MATESTSAFKVCSADGSVSIAGSLAEARRRVTRRTEHDPPTPGLLPATIWELTRKPGGVDKLFEKLVETIE